MTKEEKQKHYCDNINCNHNDTKGLCCLFNPDNCKYRQLQKENAELKDKLEILILVGNTCTKGLNDQLTKAKRIIKKLLLALKNENFDYTFALKNTHHVLAEAEQFIKDDEINEK